MLDEEIGTKRVIVIGGGFAGAYCAQHLYKRLPEGWEVTLLDRNNFLLFYPLLVEAGVGSLEPRHVVVPLRDFMKKGDFRMAEVLGVDTERQLVRYTVVGSEQETSLHYDHLVIAPGSVTKIPEDIPGLRENAFELKSLGDSVLMRDRGIRLLEIANAVEDSELRKALLRIVVVGSSFTGIELAGEYQDFMADALKSYPNLKREDLSVIVLEYADRILPALDKELADYALKHLQWRGLDIRTETSVKEVGKKKVTLTTGEKMRTYTTVWCAGIAPSPLLKRVSQLQFDDKGYVLCETDMRVKGFENVWSAGDCARNEDPSGNIYAATAQNASRQGVWMAKNIISVIQGQATKPFVYKALGSVAALGCRTAVAKAFGFKVAGFPAWFMYRTLYLFKMPGWARRVRIMLDWTVDLFLKQRPVQLGVRRIEVPLESSHEYEEAVFKG